MRLGAFELNEPVPQLKETHALVTLRPWVDVGNVGTLLLNWLENHFDTRELGKLARPGDFYDFTRYRPSTYVNGEQRRITVPNTKVNYSVQESGNDFLFLHLLEPHSHGEVYIESILRLLARSNVKRYVLVGSMYDYVPHTKPLIITGGSTSRKIEQELTKNKIEATNYQGPTSITFMISQRAPEMGIETLSLIVHLPQYTQMEEDYMGTLRIMNILGSFYNIPPDETYAGKAKQQLEQINIALDKNPRIKSIVQQLESHYEARTHKEKEETPQLSPEVEKFLAEMDRRFREG